MQAVLTEGGSADCVLLSWEQAVVPAGIWPSKESPALLVSHVLHFCHPVLCQVSLCTAEQASLSLFWLFFGSAIIIISAPGMCKLHMYKQHKGRDKAKVNWIKLLVVVVQGRQECQFSVYVPAPLSRCKGWSHHSWLIAHLVSCKEA